MQGSGRGFREVGVGSGKWEGVQESGRGLREMGEG